MSSAPLAESKASVQESPPQIRKTFPARWGPWLQSVRLLFIFIPALAVVVMGLLAAGGLSQKALGIWALILLPALFLCKKMFILAVGINLPTAIELSPGSAWSSFGTFRREAKKWELRLDRRLRYEVRQPLQDLVGVSRVLWDDMSTLRQWCLGDITSNEAWHLSFRGASSDLVASVEDSDGFMMALQEVCQDTEHPLAPLLANAGRRPRAEARRVTLSGFSDEFFASSWSARVQLIRLLLLCAGIPLLICGIGIFLGVLEGYNQIMGVPIMIAGKVCIALSLGVNLPVGVVICPGTSPDRLEGWQLRCLRTFRLALGVNLEELVDVERVSWYMARKPRFPQTMYGQLTDNSGLCLIFKQGEFTVTLEDAPGFLESLAAHCKRLGHPAAEKLMDQLRDLNSKKRLHHTEYVP